MVKIKDMSDNELANLVAGVVQEEEYVPSAEDCPLCVGTPICGGINALLSDYRVMACPVDHAKDIHTQKNDPRA